MIQRIDLVQSKFSNAVEWLEVKTFANTLEHYLNSNLEQLHALNQPGQSSKGVELLIEPLLLKNGFSHEPKQDYLDLALRPDYVNKTMKAIVEVERGKITLNNMDMLDFWKTHIHPECRYLILLIPNVLYHSKKNKEMPFERVSYRMKQFFKEGHYTNVRGLILIGY